jgi:hypothetical protein
MATEQEELSRSKSRRRARGGWPASNTIVRLMLEAAERARADANNHNDMGVGGGGKKNQSVQLSDRGGAPMSSNQSQYSTHRGTSFLGVALRRRQKPHFGCHSGSQEARQNALFPLPGIQVHRTEKQAPGGHGWALQTRQSAGLFCCFWSIWGDVNLWSINQRFSPIDPVRNP